MNSHEQHLQTNEQMSQNEQIFNDLASESFVEATKIGLDPSQFDISGDLTGGGAINRGEGMLQTLNGVIQAGNEHFGVVAATYADPENPDSELKSGLILTRFGKEGERASIVGALEPGSPLTIGRSHQEGLSSTTSREHFMVGINNEGKLVIQDLQSANGTELLVKSQDEKALPSDLNDINKWAPKTSNVKSAVLGIQGGEYIDRALKLENQSTQEQDHLINEVPKSAEDAEAMLAEKANILNQEKEAVKLAKEQELSEKLKAIEEPFNEEDRHNLWAYSAGRMNKKAAQIRGDGNDSIFQEQQSGKAYYKLSPEAQEVADNYRYIMEELNISRLS